MHGIAQASSDDRRALFHNTASKSGLSDAIVEKDFWVCWTLDYLFHASPWQHGFAFKGGTSLSKCYGMIKRFSEDIDLILDWRFLGYGASEPWENRSKTQQQRFCESMNTKTEQFLADDFVPALKSDLSQMLNDEFDINVDAHDHQTVCFDYPKAS